MKGEISIIGIIGEDVLLKDVISQAQANPNAESYTVYLSSRGGSVSVGEDIYYYLKSLGVPINMVGINVVASIATLIFMAGTTRTVEEGTQFLIHLPHIPNIQNATSDQLDYYSEELKKIEKRVVDFYVKNTNINEEGIRSLLKEDTTLNDEQLYNMGFTTTNNLVQLETVAYLDNKNSNDMNKKEESKTIIEMIKKFLKVEDDVVSKMLLTAEQKEVVFPNVEDTSAIAVGDEATIDGQTAEGEVLMADGKTLVFESGKLSKIVEPEPEVDQEKEALKAENKEVNEKLTELDAELKKVTAELKEATDVLKNIKNIQSKMIAEDKKEVKKEIKKGTDIDAMLEAFAKN